VDEPIRLQMGNAFDIVAKRVQTDFQVLKKNREYRSSYQITLRNHKEQDVVVFVYEPLEWTGEIEKSSQEYVRASSKQLRFDVPVAAGGTAELTFTIRVKVR
jgi:hypothetical protein